MDSRNASKPISTDPIPHWRLLNVATGEESVTTREMIVKKWKPGGDTLACGPLETRFDNPLRLASVKTPLYRRIRRQQDFCMLLVGLSIALFLLSPDYSYQSTILTLFALVIFVIADRVAFPTPESMADRSDFLRRIRQESGPAYLVTAVVALLSMLVSPFWGQSFQSIAASIGALVSPVLSGEVWRVVISPFIHAGFAHWAFNMSLLLLFLPLSAHRGLSVAVVCFTAGLLASQAAFLAAATAGWLGADLLVGISGGIFALVAYTSMDSLANREAYPGRFYLYMWSFLALCLTSAEMVNANSSLVGHSGGALAGIGVFLLQRLIRIERPLNPE